MSTKSNWPRSLLSAAIDLSPWKTRIVTADWLSSAVENVWLLFVGIVVFLSISFVNTPPNVSIPRDSGVTSSNKTSLTSPDKTPPWTAAPSATTSSGFTLLFGSFPKKVLTVSITFGILVMPPTRIISLISPAFSPASFSASSHGFTVLWIRSSAKDSNLDLEIGSSKCLGPDASAEIKGIFTLVCSVVDNSIFAFSAPSFNLCNASLSSRKSIEFFFLNSSAK